MMFSYLKDVSDMVTVISAVRENIIEIHLQVGRAVLPQLFAFGHMNYIRCLTCQYVTLSKLNKTKPKSWAELKENGFAGSLSDELYFTVHRDYVTEVTTNREVKVGGGPMQERYSTSLKVGCFYTDQSPLGQGQFIT